MVTCLLLHVHLEAPFQSPSRGALIKRGRDVEESESRARKVERRELAKKEEEEVKLPRVKEVEGEMGMRRPSGPSTRGGCRRQRIEQGCDVEVEVATEEEATEEPVEVAVVEPEIKEMEGVVASTANKAGETLVAPASPVALTPVVGEVAEVR
ncbi:MAG: hypothetical protein MMC33_010265 [Icmadophila ericetorum]|nr:hypothetical protein [Icmadophila ericetorum]